jgi:hypothetical protein
VYGTKKNMNGGIAAIKNKCLIFNSYKLANQTNELIKIMALKMEIPSELNPVNFQSKGKSGKKAVRVWS